MSNDELSLRYDKHIQDIEAEMERRSNQKVGDIAYWFEGDTYVRILEIKTVNQRTYAKIEPHETQDKYWDTNTPPLVELVHLHPISTAADDEKESSE